jgi:hypothetical protein
VKTRLVITLELECRRLSTTSRVSLGSFDVGVIQDAINTFVGDERRHVEVTDASVDFADSDSTDDGTCAAFVAAVVHDAAQATDEKGNVR